MLNVLYSSNHIWQTHFAHRPTGQLNPTIFVSHIKMKQSITQYFELVTWKIRFICIIITDLSFSTYSRIDHIHSACYRPVTFESWLEFTDSKPFVVFSSDSNAYNFELFFSSNWFQLVKPLFSHQQSQSDIKIVRTNWIASLIQWHQVQLLIYIWICIRCC